MTMFGPAEAQQANYACAALPIIILLGRIGVTIWTRRKLDVAFALVVCSIGVVITRVTINHFYLKFGTANDAINDKDYFQTHNPNLIKEGTILSLVARVIITVTCWLQISILLLFYSSMIYSIKWVQWMIKATWATAGLTLVAIVLSTFLECHPFDKYWQLHPDPGTCVRAYVQLLVQGTSNIVLDLMLLVIAFPLIKVSHRSLVEHLRVGSLFLVGTFCIIVTILRLTSIFATGSAQPTRSLWASVQMVVSIFVANVPSVYGMCKVRKRKKSEPMIRRQSRADDLFQTPTSSTSATSTSPIYTNMSEKILYDELNSDKNWSQHKEDVNREVV